MEASNKTQLVDWSQRSSEEVLNHFRVTKEWGLAHTEVADQRAKYGLNQLPEAQSRTLLGIFLKQFLSPLIYLLLVSAGIAFFLGEQKDAWVILFVVFMNSVIGAFQEGRAESSLKSLKKLSLLKARVFRDGQEIEIAAQELVPGDVFLVSAGDAVPTDGRIIESSSLAASEAALTGESLPVSKNTEPLTQTVALADRTNMLYAGTYISAGRARAIAVSIGLENEIGKIAKLATETEQPKTQLEKKIEQFGRALVVVSVFLFLLVVMIGVLKGFPFSEIFMVAVSQMVSLIPEGLPVAMTIALAVGVQRMAQRKTVVRRLAAVEGLGSTTVICSDKTGTLTKNEMTVVSLHLLKGRTDWEVSGTGYSPQGEIRERDSGNVLSADALQRNESLQELLRASVCCNDAQVIYALEKDKSIQVLGDPTEAALLILAQKAHLNVENLRRQFPRTAEIPFDSDHKMMATEHVVGEKTVVYLKGAPEAVLKLAELSEEDRKWFIATSEAMAKKALRVLAVGMIPNAHIRNQTFESFQGRVEVLGLVGQWDPPREEVREAVKECEAAGVVPVMITGDHKVTGAAIARKLGVLKEEHLCLDGEELDRLSPEELKERITDIRVVARVQPSQKVLIVKTLQNAGHVVAMTGDGVNDAPALMQAHVGVAMGITGTEVAKEAAKIVITDDNFSTIVAAISEGRLVYQNIKKLLLFLFVTSLDEVVVLLLALVLGYPPPLAAVQILWINLVSEGALTVNLIMEPAEGNEMIRPPVPLDEPLLDRNLLKRMPLMVLASVISTFGWFWYRSHLGVAPEVVQTETFTVLVVCQWFNVLNCRSATQSVFSRSIFKNPWLVLGLVLANILHFLVIYWEPLGQFFHTVPISSQEFFKIGLVASLVLWVEELRKLKVRWSMKSVFAL